MSLDEEPDLDIVQGLLVEHGETEGYPVVAEGHPTLLEQGQLAVEEEVPREEDGEGLAEWWQGQGDEKEEARVKDTGEPLAEHVVAGDEPQDGTAAVGQAAAGQAQRGQQTGQGSHGEGQRIPDLLNY